MRTESITPLVSPAIRNGVLVLGGYGLRASVERRHLVLSDGIGHKRRWMRLSKATCGLTRFVILGHSGSVTLEALRWLHDIEAAFVQIDADGQVIVSSGPLGLNDARLRRAQVQAGSSVTGLKIIRDLLGEKFRGQADVLVSLGAHKAAADIRTAVNVLKAAELANRLRLIEAEIAAKYWKEWEKIPVRFARKDENIIPDHWRTFGTRSSPITGKSRLAATPANALLNYLYAILEMETRIACLVMGFDPGIGVLHADQPSRDSLALDLMEALRPRVDAFVLDMLRTRTFNKDAFTETRQGVCRLLPPLTHSLAETASSWAKLVAPMVEQVARAFAAGYGEAKRNPQWSIPTRLTQDNRSAGRNSMRRSHKRPAGDTSPAFPQACRICGVLIKETDRLYCDTCLPERRREVTAFVNASGLQELARLRAEGRDPAHGGLAARERGLKNGQHSQQAAVWSRQHAERMDTDVFKKEILPWLSYASLRDIVQATGLSREYCRGIRRGRFIPHPRHWEILRCLKRIVVSRV